MQNNDLAHIDVLALLPQRPPFVMIDRLTHFDETVTQTCFEVRHDNLFMEADGMLNPCALVENIAQTCAARMGYINHISKAPVRLGFIGAIKHLEIVRPAREGEVLTTRIEVLQEVMAVTMVSATVKVGEETIVTAEMKIAMSDINAKN